MLEKRSLDNRAAEVLRRDILRGQYPPATRLTEISLADRLGLSRGTIRSALYQLASEGLVRQIPYTGWEIPNVSDQDCWELQTLRNALEGLAANLAATRLTPAGRDLLQRTYQELLEINASGRLDETCEADWQLHRTIVELSGHERLREHYRLVERQIRLLIALSNARYVQPEMIGLSHESIIAAMLAGDGESAEKFARVHNPISIRVDVNSEPGSAAPDC